MQLAILFAVRAIVDDSSEAEPGNFRKIVRSELTGDSEVRSNKDDFFHVLAPSAGVQGRSGLSPKNNPAEAVSSKGADVPKEKKIPNTMAALTHWNETVSMCGV